MNSTDRRNREYAGAVWAVTAAFGCYFCMYAFRKPFTSASYAGTEVFGIGFKTILVITQVLGYMLSKFSGIKVIAEMPPGRRARMLFLLVGSAEVTLILFGLIARPWNAGCLFLNGLFLGLVYGLVMGFLEGRRFTEALTAGLCASFILADGVTKSTGAFLLKQGIAEDWMPAAAGLVYLLPFTLFVLMLAQIPKPTSDDVAVRSERHVMHAGDRIDFLKRHWFGLTPIVIMFLGVTLLRSIRADFAPEIWRSLGSPAAPSTFSISETWVALGVVIVNGTAVLIFDNRRAFFSALAVCGAGIGLLAVALVARQAQAISSFPFMVLMGLGLYLPYVAVHTTVFERILAMTRDRGNVGFLMYVADSVGYLGYVVVLLARQFWSANMDFLVWFNTICWITIIGSIACLLTSWRHYYLATRSIVVNANEPPRSPGSNTGET